MPGTAAGGGRNSKRSQDRFSRADSLEMRKGPKLGPKVDFEKQE
jgi:hypothetical protein